MPAKPRGPKTSAHWVRDKCASRRRVRVGRERLGRLQILDHGAEINRLGIESAILCDLGPVHDAEAIPLEHLFAAPALKSHDLPVNLLFPAAVEITQIRTHERARG